MPSAPAPSTGNPPRLFIGIRPDAATQHYLDALTSHCAQALRNTRSDIRWTSHSNRHLTLAFLGETAASHLPAIVRTLQHIAGDTPACSARIVSLQPFPRRGARLLAAELLPNPDLDRLHERCRQLMAKLGMTPEGSAYRPHFTLARSARGFDQLQPLTTDFIAPLDNIVLYQSLMAPGGSQYVPIHEVKLERISRG